MGGLMTLILLASALHAQDSSTDEQARMLYNNGRMLFDEERYEDALLAWQEAYALSDRPLLLYNIALAHEKLGNYGEAIESLYKYRIYATPDEQEALLVKIEELQVLVNSAPEEGTEVPPALVETARPAPVVVAPPETGPRSGALLAWASAGVTGSTAVVFTTLTIRQYNQAYEYCSDELGEERTMCLSEGASQYTQLERFSTIADVSWGLSVLSIGTALWMSARSTNVSGQARPSLWVEPGRLGIKGTF